MNSESFLMPHWQTSEKRALPEYGKRSPGCGLAKFILLLGDQTEFAPDVRQPQIGIVVAQQKPMLRPGREQTIGLIDALGHDEALA